MDKITKYRNIVEKYLRHRASLGLASSPGAKGHLVVDREKDEYVLLWVGWSGVNYKHGLMFHLQIMEGKVWIHENRTDIDIVQVLTESGISKSDIVLGFVAPYSREVGGVALGA